jgi:hypothetical protein
MTSQKESSAKFIEHRIARDMAKECIRARSLYPPFHNAHEDYAVLLEEVDELWEAVRLKQSNPDRDRKILEEANQIGAMAIRIILDCRESSQVLQ